MDFAMIFAVILLVFIAYYFIYDTYEKPDTLIKKNKIDDTPVVIKKDMEVLIKAMTGPYVAINNLTRYLYLTNDKTRAEIFKIHVDNTNKKSPKIYLLSQDNFYVNLKYTPFAKNEYDVNANINEKVNTTRLKINKSSKGTYIKFSNGFYMSIFNDTIYSSRDKTRIFYFKFLSK